MDEYDLIRAVRGGDRALVEGLLDRGADPDAGGFDRRTPLCWAICGRDRGMVELLLSRGADPNEGLDWTLSSAIGLGLPEFVKLLLEAGARAEGRFLNYAALEGRADMVLMFLEHGGRAGELSGDGRNALHYLARFGPAHARPLRPKVLEGLVARLVRAGADPNHFDRFGDTPLMVAARSDNAVMVRLLAGEGADPGLEREGRFALSEARTPGVAAELLKAGAPLDQAERALERLMLANDQRTGAAVAQALPAGRGEVFRRGLDLMRASNILELVEFERTVRAHAHSGEMRRLGGLVLAKSLFWTKYGWEKAKLLIECGARLDLPVYPSPLVVAVEQYWEEMVRLLLENGAGPDQGGGGSSPLLCALGSSRLYDERFRPSREWRAKVSRMAEILLQAGADPNLADGEGLSPLHMAVSMCPDMVLRLLQAGANPNVFDKRGRTPLMDADAKAAELLLQAGADPNARTAQGRTAMHLAQTTTKARLLAAHGGDPSARDNDGAPPLFIHIWEARLPLVRWFANRKGNRKQLDATGRNALIMTALSRLGDDESLELAKKFLKQGENPLQIDAAGRSLFLRAAVARKNKLALWALDQGCDIDLQDNTGATGLMYAAQQGNSELLAALLERGAALDPRDNQGRRALDLARLSGLEDKVKGASGGRGE